MTEDDQRVRAAARRITHDRRHRTRDPPAVRQEHRSAVIDEAEDVYVDPACFVFGRGGSEREQGARGYGHHDGPVMEPDLAAPAHQAAG